MLVYTKNMFKRKNLTHDSGVIVVKNVKHLGSNLNTHCDGVDDSGGGGITHTAIIIYYSQKKNGRKKIVLYTNLLKTRMRSATKMSPIGFR